MGHATEVPAADGEWARAIALDDEPDLPASRSAVRIAFGAVLVLAATAWLGLVGAGLSGISQAGDLALTIAISCVPLALLALLWLLFARASSVDPVVRARSEAAAIEAALHGLVARLVEERAALADQTALLGLTGSDVVRQIEATALSLGEETALIGLRAEQLDQSAAAARIDLGAMLADLPLAEAQAARVGERLREAGRAALDGAGQLDQQLTRVTTNAREAEAGVGGAAERLAAEVARIDAASADAGRGIELVAAGMARAANDALDRASRAVEAMRQAIEAEGEALGAVIERARSALASAGADRLGEVDARLAAVRERLDGLSQRMADEADASLTLVRTLDQSFEGITQRFQALGDRNAECTADIAESIATLGEHADGLSRRLGESASRAGAALDERLTLLGELRARLERDVAEAERTNAAKGGASLARQVTPMVEALNSTSVDVARLLGGEVSDAAWAAYLKGDRGGFTRAAVRLIGAGEARDVLARYGADPAFHTLVNRYIHEFETMLRRVLADGEDSPLAVALLSSDMGKLYVALAQAIERLRG